LFLPLLARAHRHARILRIIPVHHTIFFAPESRLAPQAAKDAASRSNTPQHCSWRRTLAMSLHKMRGTHSDLRMLARYAHVVPQDQRAAVDRTVDVFLRRSAANLDGKPLRIN